MPVSGLAAPTTTKAQIVALSLTEITFDVSAECCLKCHLAGKNGPDSVAIKLNH